MNKKQKILIISSSVALGLAVLFILFLGKDSKNNNQDQASNVPEEKENNQQLPEKKKKSSVLQIILIIIGIIIIVFIIFLIIKKRKEPKITDEELKKYLSGKCTIILKGKKLDEIKVYFYPYSLTKPNEITDQLFNLDINKDEEKILPELQDVYKSLKTKKNVLDDFGNAMADFFKIFDGHFLEAVYNDDPQQEKYFTITNMFDKIKKQINTKGTNKDKVEVHSYFVNYQEDGVKFINEDEDKNKVNLINIEKEKDPLNFFKKVINSSNKSNHLICFQSKENKEEEENEKKIFLFERYCSLLRYIVIIIEDLKLYFSKNKNSKYEQKFQDAEKKIANFFNEEKLTNIYT